MTLEKFPDPKQVRILEFLSKHCHGARPLDGWQADALAVELGIDYDDLRLPMEDLEDRGYVATDGGDSTNPLGSVVVTAAGRDFLHRYREEPRLAALAKRSRLWQYCWEAIKVVGPGVVGYVLGKLT